MGCFPPALLTTIKDATDRRVGCSSSPALRSASLPAALAMEGLGLRVLPCGTAAPRLPARAGRKHLRLLQCSAAGASRLVPGKPCSPGLPCHPTAGSAGVGTCSPRQRWWVRRQGERGGLWSWSAEHDARAQPLASPGRKLLLRRYRSDPASLIRHNRRSVGFLPG